MKKFFSILLCAALVFPSQASADYVFNPFTKKLDAVSSGGGGSGTVSSGLAGYFSYYPSNGTTVDDQSVLYTNGSGIGIGTSSLNTNDLLNGSKTYTTPTAQNNFPFSLSISGSSSDGSEDSNNRGFFLQSTWTGTKGNGTHAGFYAITQNNATAGVYTHQLSIVGRAYNLNSASIANGIAGGYFTVNNQGSGTITAAYNVWAAGGGASAGTIANWYNFFGNVPSITGTGAITNAYGMAIPDYTTAGATNNNIGLTIGGAPTGPVSYAQYIGAGEFYTKGKVTLTPNSITTASGTDKYLTVSLTQTAAQTGTLRGIDVLVQSNLSTGGTIANIEGSFIDANNGNNSTVTNLVAYKARIKTANASAVVSTGKGFEVTTLTNTGTFTNTYGFYCGDITTGTQTNTPYCFYASDANAYNYFAGNSGFGTVTSPARALHTTVERLEPQASAPHSPSSGDIYVDSSPTPDELCFYDGSAWQGISSGTDDNCA